MLLSRAYFRGDGRVPEPPRGPPGREARPELLPRRSVTASPGRHGRHGQDAHTSAARELLLASRASACDLLGRLKSTPQGSALAGFRPADRSATKTQTLPAPRFRVPPPRDSASSAQTAPAALCALPWAGRPSATRRGGERAEEGGGRRGRG